ncbi:MAG: LysM peptidoglycan-binding domain-containing protein [Lysobacterales bacterium]
MFKPLLAIIAGSLLCASAAAQVELRDDHPDRYVVVKGDTLWDISDRFLQKPWLWPEIWQVNPQIENPHLIYPGDEINLVYIDGEPRLSLRRGRKLSPHPRRTSLAEAIEPINLNDIRHYLDKRTILDAAELENLPYVVAMEESYLAATEGHRVYVRGLEGAAVGESYAIVRPSVEFRETPETWPYDKAESFRPETRDWEYPAERSIADFVSRFWTEKVLSGKYKNTRILGYEVVQTATAEVLTLDDPTTLLLTSSELEVLPGDLVIPLFTANYDLEYYPHAPESVPDNTQVIALSNALFGVGPTQVVAINKGWEDGIEHGDVFATFRPGFLIRDEIKYPRDDVKTFFSKERRKQARVQLPDEYSAHVMIFKSHERVSYGLIMRGKQAVRILDKLKMP